jgi:hypothetical protein
MGQDWSSHELARGCAGWREGPQPRGLGDRTAPRKAGATNACPWPPRFASSVKPGPGVQRPGAVPRASPLPRASRFSFATSQNELVVIRMITGRTKWG